MSLKHFWYRVSHWETWDWRIKYIPLAPVWCWYCLRARSWWFFTTSNPSLTFGGFEGESKREMYEQLPPGSYPATVYLHPSMTSADVATEARKVGFPCVAKPDVGKMGLMFRHIHSQDELTHYHRSMNGPYLLQELVNYPLEVSVFYYRFPSETKGHITGFLKKEFLQVTGDGTATLLQLIQRDACTRVRLNEMKTKHKHNLHRVIPAGEAYCLSYALNLSRGGKLISLESEKDQKLLNIFDGLSLYAKNFYYGRYDIKCRSIEALKEGRDFSILEYNGSGAEPHHVYGNGNSLWKAICILASHWRILFQISRHNHSAGIPHWKFLDGLKFIRAASRHVHALKLLDRHTAVTWPLPPARFFKDHTVTETVADGGYM